MVDQMEAAERPCWDDVNVPVTISASNGWYSFLSPSVSESNLSFKKEDPNRAGIALLYNQVKTHMDSLGINAHRYVKLL
jgi:hypothetical protein